LPRMEHHPTDMACQQCPLKGETVVHDGRWYLVRVRCDCKYTIPARPGDFERDSLARYFGCIFRMARYVYLN
jgi:hypothetical protein